MPSPRTPPHAHMRLHELYRLRRTAKSRVEKVAIDQLIAEKMATFGSPTPIRNAT